MGSSSYGESLECVRTCMAELENYDVVVIQTFMYYKAVKILNLFDIFTSYLFPFTMNFD